MARVGLSILFRVGHRLDGTWCFFFGYTFRSLKEQPRGRRVVTMGCTGAPTFHVGRTQCVEGRSMCGTGHGTGHGTGQTSFSATVSMTPKLLRGDKIDT